MNNNNYRDVMNVAELLVRANSEGIHITEYTLRRAIRSGQIPCRIVGRAYLVSWEKFYAWISCADGCDKLRGFIKIITNRGKHNETRLHSVSRQ